MGTYLLGTIYDVIAPFLLEMVKNISSLKMISMKFDSFLSFSHLSSVTLRILRLFKLIFFPESFTSFLKIPQA